MSRIQIEVAYDDREYEVTAHIDDISRLGAGLIRPSRDELFAEIDRSVAQIKAAIKEGE